MRLILDSMGPENFRKNLEVVFEGESATEPLGFQVMTFKGNSPEVDEISTVCITHEQAKVLKKFVDCYIWSIENKSWGIEFNEMTGNESDE